MAGDECSGRGKGRSGGLGSRVAGAFVIFSVAAALLPLRRYVERLSRDEFVLWAAAVVWVVTLPLAFVGVLRGLRRWLGRGGGKTSR